MTRNDDGDSILAISTCNRSYCLFIAKEYIVKGYVPAEFAAQAISAIVPSVETPTKELLSSFYVRESYLF